MATARLVCSECGNELSRGDRFCTKCGSRIDDGTQHTEASLTCEICGHVNTHTGAYCEACGAKLPGATLAGQSRAEKLPAAASKKKKSLSGKAEPFRLQPRHYAAGVVLIALLGYFMYLEFQRDTGGDVHAGMQVPTAAGSSSPPPKEILDAIERLEMQVKENPTNDGARLLLANALHDAGMHDPRMLPRAIDAYKQYLMKKPNDPNARVDLGICYFELGKLDTTRSGSLFSMAINEMESAVKISPTHQSGAFNLGIVYLYAGNMKESNKWFKKAIELNPESDLGKRAKEILDQHAQVGL
jgi:tetratricopeptide (TPR) repeat protein